MNNSNLDSTWNNTNDQPIDPFEEAKKKNNPSQKQIEPSIATTPKPTYQAVNQLSDNKVDVNFSPKHELKTDQYVHEPNKSRLSFLKNILKTILIFIGILVFVYLFLNIPTLFSKAEYQINPPKEDNITMVKAENGKNSPPGINDIWEAFFQMAIKQTIKNLPPAPEPPKEEPKPVETAPATTAKKTTKSTTSNSTTLGNNSIYIAKIGIKVPVVWNSPVDEQTVLDNLHNGVVHYAGTPLPGEGKGPIFISGHSSYYWWDKGAYKKVFANLNNVDVGDNIVINYEGTIYTYQVFDKIVVLPEEVDVLNQVNEPILDLMTCVPVGTNQKRLIVKSKQI